MLFIFLIPVVLICAIVRCDQLEEKKKASKKNSRQLKNEKISIDFKCSITKKPSVNVRDTNSRRSLKKSVSFNEELHVKSI